jgi:hypothetical protein
VAREMMANGASTIINAATATSQIELPTKDACRLQAGRAEISIARDLLGCGNRIRLGRQIVEVWAIGIKEDRLGIRNNCTSYLQSFRAKWFTPLGSSLGQSALSECRHMTLRRSHRRLLR